MRQLVVAVTAVVALMLGGAGGAPAGCNPNLAWQDTDAVWSPTGDRLAWVREEVGCAPAPRSLLVGAPDGTVRRTLRKGSRPSWSPDGRRLVWAADRLTVLDVRTGGLDELGPGQAPAWGASGLIAFVRAQGVAGRDLLVVDPRTGAERRLLDDEPSLAAPAWTPAGDALVVVRHPRPRDERSQLVLVSLDGSVRELTAADGKYASPSFAPDGTLVFGHEAPGRSWDVEAIAAGRRRTLAGSDADEVLPAVAPGGERVAWVRLVGPVDGVLAHRPLDGEATPDEVAWDVHPRSAPAFRPGGAEIAYASGDPCERWGIHLVERSGFGLRRLTNRCVFHGSPRADRIRATPFLDFLWGWDGDDVLLGLEGADRLDGGNGRDRLAAGPGQDVVLGGNGADVLYGGNGPDLLLAGRGRDRVFGGRGADEVRVRDGRRDVVDCGAGRGRDVVIADRLDVVARDCELVRR